MYRCQNPARAPKGNVRAEEEFAYYLGLCPQFHTPTTRERERETLHIVNIGIMKTKVINLLYCSTRHDT
jgi:hypothetical protein